MNWEYTIFSKLHVLCCILDYIKSFAITNYGNRTDDKALKIKF